jgi:hypothetical protein
MASRMKATPCTINSAAKPQAAGLIALKNTPW